MYYLLEFACSACKKMHVVHARDLRMQRTKGALTRAIEGSTPCVQVRETHGGEEADVAL
jgi:hypothetical protein